MRRAIPWWLFAWLSFASWGWGADVIPPAPARYFNDYAQVVSQPVSEALNQRLVDFEKATSSQIVVAIFPKLPADAVLEDFTVRAFKAWKIGQRNKDNGVALFVFVEDRRMRIEVGYGLEGALPDSLAKRIIEEEIKPHLVRGDYDAGLSAGVQALLQATRGEYRGTGRTAADRRRSRDPQLIFIVFMILFAVVAALRRARGTVYDRSGRRHWGGWTSGGWGGMGGGWSGGGGGGGGFSGGGGRSGGGGASGSW